MKIKIVLLTALFLLVSSTGFAQSKPKVMTPETVVKNLYAARKSQKTDPFFQKKNRALLDKYFTKNLADF